MKALLAMICATATGAAAGALACGEGLPWRAAEAGHSVAFRALPEPIVAGRHFKLELQLCAPAGQPPGRELRVDADMPAHRHGMNYRASLEALGDGRYRAEGLLFHMPGRWRFIFDVATAQGPLRLTHEVLVP